MDDAGHNDSLGPGPSRLRSYLSDRDAPVCKNLAECFPKAFLPANLLLPNHP